MSPKERLHPVRMIDVASKGVTDREAVARGRVTMKPETVSLIKEGKMTKGDVLAVAQVAGIMAAKNTSQLIPLCHPLALDEVSVEFELGEEGVDIIARAKAAAKTGVEMEALTAVSAAALSIYDMCKAVDRGMHIEGIRLSRKSGGKSGTVVLE